jgi:MSHA pilin protein MshD
MSRTRSRLSKAAPPRRGAARRPRPHALRAHDQSGFSLLELVVAIVVLGLVFSGFASVYATVMQRSTEPELDLQALAVAEAYLNEAASRPFRDPDTGTVCGGPEPQRPAFDDVCDYDGLAQNGCTAVSGTCPLGECACGRLGQPLDGLRGFIVGVDVTPATVLGTAALRVRVEVARAGAASEPVALETLRAQD